MNEYLKMNFIHSIAAKLSEDMTQNEEFLEKQFFLFKKKITTFCSEENNLLNCFRTLKNVEACFSFEINDFFEKKSSHFIFFKSIIVYSQN